MVSWRADKKKEGTIEKIPLRNCKRSCWGKIASSKKETVEIKFIRFLLESEVINLCLYKLVRTPLFLPPHAPLHLLVLRNFLSTCILEITLPSLACARNLQFTSMYTHTTHIYSGVQLWNKIKDLRSSVFFSFYWSTIFRYPTVHCKATSIKPRNLESNLSFLSTMIPSRQLRGWPVHRKHKIKTNPISKVDDKNVSGDTVLAGCKKRKTKPISEQSNS